jgi:hypothetical protein
MIAEAAISWTQLGIVAAVVAGLVGLALRIGAEQRAALRDDVADLKVKREEDRTECERRTRALEARVDALTTDWAGKVTDEFIKVVAPAIEEAVTRGVDKGVQVAQRRNP